MPTPMMQRLLRLTFHALLGFACLCSAPAANLVFMIGEDEYLTWETLPEFAKSDVEPLGHQVTIIHADATDKNHFPGLVDALRDADLVLVSVRRRTPVKEQLDALRAYLDSGKPLIGIRTASHAFALREKDPAPDAAHAVWQAFDPEVFGGNYVNHYKAGPQTQVSLAEGAAGHPILEGISVADLASACSLYKVSPLAPSAKPLLLGTIPDQPAEPIAWTHGYGSNHAAVFYTSLGGADDFGNPAFRRLLLNAFAWALNPSDAK